MFEVSVEKTIACAHRLFGYDGPCEALHGHNYRILISFTGEDLDQFGMLVDFGDIKAAFYRVLDSLDHTYLNDLPEFRTLSPSAENIARYVFVEMKKTPFPRARLGKVSVWETPTQMASYEER
jgi:6-pyruvoyltetrahydropterin/6-carboxytetrahydropterin synthase